MIRRELAEAFFRLGCFGGGSPLGDGGRVTRGRRTGAEGRGDRAGYDKKSYVIAQNTVGLAAGRLHNSFLSDSAGRTTRIKLAGGGPPSPARPHG